MEIYVKISFISLFSIFSGFQTWFYQMRWFSQPQTQQVMTSQISSHIEYLIQIYYILVLILWSKLMKNQDLMACFNRIWWWFVIVAYFFGSPCIYSETWFDELSSTYCAPVSSRRHGIWLQKHLRELASRLAEYGSSWKHRSTFRLCIGLHQVEIMECGLLFFFEKTHSAFTRAVLSYTRFKKLSHKHRL